MKCKSFILVDFRDAESRALITISLRRYNFKSDPRSVGAVVILSADESTYIGESFSISCVKLGLKLGWRPWTAQI